MSKHNTKPSARKMSRSPRQEAWGPAPQHQRPHPRHALGLSSFLPRRRQQSSGSLVGRIARASRRQAEVAHSAPRGRKRQGRPAVAHIGRAAFTRHRPSGPTQDRCRAQMSYRHLSLENLRFIHRHKGRRTGRSAPPAGLHASLHSHHGPRAPAPACAPHASSRNRERRPRLAIPAYLAIHSLLRHRSGRAI